MVRAEKVAGSTPTLDLCSVDMLRTVYYLMDNLHNSFIFNYNKIFAEIFTLILVKYIKIFK